MLGSRTAYKLYKEKNSPQLNGMFTREVWQETMERRNYYAADRLVTLAGAFIDESLGFVERCSLARMKML